MYGSWKVWLPYRTIGGECGISGFSWVTVCVCAISMAFVGNVRVEDTLLNLTLASVTETETSKFPHMVIGVVVSNRSLSKSMVVRGLKKEWPKGTMAC